ncbi:MAG: hypothetical protein ACRDL7_03405 [Gaiellaceae bacterium]
MSSAEYVYYGILRRMRLKALLLRKIQIPAVVYRVVVVYPVMRFQPADLLLRQEDLLKEVADSRWTLSFLLLSLRLITK